MGKGVPKLKGVNGARCTKINPKITRGPKFKGVKVMLHGRKSLPW